MKNFVLLVMFASFMMLANANYSIAACEDEDGNEVVLDDAHGDPYVSSKNLGDGSCMGCANTCKIGLGD